MSESAPAVYLLATSPDPRLGWPACASAAITAAGGQILAQGDLAGCAVLEPGTEPRAVVIAEWPSRAALMAAWPDLGGRLGDGAGTWRALAVDAAPQGADAFFPSRAKAAPAPGTGPRGYALVEGVVTDPDAIARYSAIIYPLISERGGYYRTFALPDSVAVLQGDWPHQAVILCDWPDLAALNAFWYGETYQTVAVPIRAGAGVFSVLALAGLPDAAGQE
jgi:uncharacterized protein (DUF1330 family)